MVLFVSYSGAYGGAERLLVDFASGLDTERILACPKGPLAEAARAGGLRVVHLTRRSLNLRASAHEPLLAAARLAAHGLEVRRLVRDLAPELVVAWGMRSALACLLGPRLRCAVSFQHNDFLPGEAIGRLVRVAAARAELVTALSHATARDLDPEGHLGQRLEVIHPGVDIDRYDTRAAPATPPEVLVLGALTEWKRPDVALEACALARRERPELRLRLVGAPFEEDGDRFLRALEERASRPDLAGSVEFAGAVPDARAELERATCLLHCAEREPFGIAVLEALAAGRPAVVPDAEGPAEIVDRSCGLLYPAGDAHGAADAIVEVLSDPDRAAQMGAAGRARARRLFGRGAQQSKYAAAIGALLGGSDSVLEDSGSTGAGECSQSAQRSLALVTVTHNSAAELEALLDSVGRHLPGTRVVVVDCDSRDASVAIARSREFVTTVSLSENVGFGRACNRGLLEVGEPVSVLVNPDVELLDDSLLTLVTEAMRADRLLAPAVLTPDGTRQDSVHPVPGSAADLIRSVIPPAAIPGRLGTALAPWRSPAPLRVGWAVGCALVARTDTLRRLGPFDERIFMYGEDLELGLHAAALGIETWFWPAGRVLHHRATSSEKAFGGEPFELLAQTRHDAVARRCGARRAARDDAAQALTFRSRLLLKRALGRPAARERRQLEALEAVRRGSDRASGGEPNGPR